MSACRDPIWQTIPRRLIADGDHVVVEARGDMMTKAGVRYDNDYCLVYRLECGKIVEIREYCDSGAVRGGAWKVSGFSLTDGGLIDEAIEKPGWPGIQREDALRAHARP